MTRTNRTAEAQDAILLVGDWNWRKGPLWRALCAALLGRRETFVTHLGDVACVMWWRDAPYLVALDDRKDALCRDCA